MRVSRAAGIFISGTDTGVGKTTVACALLRGLRARGLDVGAMKPIETGVGDAGPLDALALLAAARSEDPIELACPEQYALPAAPSVAAAREGRDVDVPRLCTAFAALAVRHRLVIVEGAGGLLVPITKSFDMADLALALGLPVLVVARASLGTINHTRLTLAALGARGLRLAGVVISHGPHEISNADADNLDALRGELGVRLVGELPPQTQGVEVSSDALDLDAILRALD